MSLIKDGPLAHLDCGSDCDPQPRHRPSPNLVCASCGWTYQRHVFERNRRRCPPLHISAFKPHLNGYERPD